MTLYELISVLNTKNVTVSVMDGETDDNIITFVAEGISGVEGDVSARPVKKWTIDGATKITVKLGVVEAPANEG